MTKEWLLDECRALLAAAPRSPEQLRDYQVKLVQFMLDTPKSALFVDMGLGKTIAVLTLLDHLFMQGQAEQALIVAPLRVAIQTWPTEIREWKHTCWLPFTLIRAQPGKAFREKMRALMRRETFIHLVNRENVAWLVEEWARLKRWPYSVVIVDESTSFADYRTARWKALAKVVQRTPRVHLLSGTPALEGLPKIFSQIYLIDDGVRFGRSITHFRESYLLQNPYTRGWKPQVGAVERVASKIVDICFTLREEDAGIASTEPLKIERPIVLEKAEMTRYRNFERELILQLPDDMEIEAVNAGVLFSKLLQFTSGAIYDEERNVHVVHNWKIEEIRQIEMECPGEPLLIVYWFKSARDRLKKAFPDAVVMDREGTCIDAWNAGTINKLLVHPQSAGHGIQLQKGPGHILVYLDIPVSGEYHSQMTKRIARPGQRQLVKVIYLVARGTVDTLVLQKLAAKADMQAELVGYVRTLRDKLKRGSNGRRVDGEIATARTAGKAC